MTKIDITPLEVDVNDGQWHGHNGAEMPEGLHEESVLTVLSRARAPLRHVCASNINWHMLHGCYCVTKAHVEPPKPREFWVIDGYARTSEEKAGFQQFNCGGEVIHVREVMTDE